LSAIAANKGVSLDALIAANPQIANPDLVSPGDKPNVPAGGDGAEGNNGTGGSTPATTGAVTPPIPKTAGGATGGNDVLSRISTTGASARTAGQKTLKSGTCTCVVSNAARRFSGNTPAICHCALGTFRTRCSATGADHTCADQLCLNFVVVKHDREQVVASSQRVTDAGLTKNRCAGKRKVLNVAIDRAF
jgi:hypothetical protein